MKHKGYYYKAALAMLEAQPTSITAREFDFDAYENATLEHLARNLTGFRQMLGESQISFARKIEVSRSQYRKYEMGLDIIRLDIAHRISLKFGLPVFFLVVGSPYQALLNVPRKDPSFDIIWRYANALDDLSFQKLCEVLQTFLGYEPTPLDTGPLCFKKQNFNLALKENKETIYIAMSESIRAIREYFNYSQEQVAELMGVALCSYREYEKVSQRPRFNLLVAIRWSVALGIHPFYALAGTEFLKFRQRQNQRIDTLMQIFNQKRERELSSLIPLIEGFYHSVQQNPLETGSVA